MNCYNSNMSEPKNKPNYAFDGTMKRVQTEVTDSSSDEESRLVNVKKSKDISLKSCPVFLVNESADDEALQYKKDSKA